MQSRGPRRLLHAVLSATQLKPTQAARFRKELTAERGKTQHAADTKKQILSMKFL